MINRRVFGVAVLGISLSFASSSLAESLSASMSELAKDPYFKIGKITATSEIVDASEMDESLVSNDASMMERSSTVAQTAGPSLFEIADLAVKVWDLVQKNKAVANVETKVASALPVGAEAKWSALTGWQPEKAVQFTLEIENGFGMKTVQLEYQVRSLFGGNFRGHGKYIASARILPTKVKVLWGYNLDVGVSVASIINTGTLKDPVAQITMDVKYQYGNMFRQSGASSTYTVGADGSIAATGAGSSTLH